jgi:hypothetical protein
MFNLQCQHGMAILMGLFHEIFEWVVILWLRKKPNYFMLTYQKYFIVAH